jgi:hypothetical protein
MLEAFVVLSVISIVLLVMAVLILIGKGDSLIAGYNTASREAQQVYDKRRVRVLVGVLLVIVATALPLFGILLVLGFKEVVLVALPVTAFILVAATFTTAHFWAKKKDTSGSSHKK